jgi:ADP-ribosyl-[dinitrogen reductase] hydrolase
LTGGLIPDHVAKEFTRHEIFGIGSTVRGFIRAYKNERKHWIQSGQPSAGNGALMRIAPVLIPHLHKPSAALWADAAIAGMITHNDPASNACCVAFINLLWECLRLREIPEPTWWIDTFTSVASQLEGNTRYESRCDGNSYQGPLWKFVDQEVHQAIAENKTTMNACEQWHSGAYLLETMPCVVYILARHGHDPEEAIIRAVNDTKDNDTVAAIVGAAVGALHGKAGLPTRWIKDLLGRTGPDDDGRVFKLIDQARQVFWEDE